MGIRHLEHLREQSFCREPEQRTCLERGPVGWPRHLLYELLQQRPHDVRRGLGLELDGASLSKQVGYQRQRQRMAVCKVEHRFVLASWHLAPPEVRLGLLPGQVAEWERSEQRLPARVRSPGGRRCPSAGRGRPERR